MKISELLIPQAIVADLQARDKKRALAELTDSLIACDASLSRDDVIEVLQEREKLGSTGIGDGVAIPHGKLAGIPELTLAFGRSRGGVDFESMDGQPAHLFFLLVAPEESVGVHLKTLARISKLLKDSAVRQKLMDAADQDAIYQVILDEEDRT
jgi:PTS system nitrogen regulatory IIA component